MNDLKDFFGKTGKDVITGFEGVITGAVSYISGCDQFLITPKVDEKGAHRDGKWYDTSRIEIQDAETIVLPAEKVKAAPGPNTAAPIQ